MRIDLHMHSSEYSGCGRSPVDSMLEAAAAAGMDAVVLTEHNLRRPAEEMRELQERHPDLLVLSGIEVKTREGEDVLVYAEDLPSALEPGIPVERLMRMVQELNGAAVLAHPYRYAPPAPQVYSVAFDGIEVMSVNIHDHTRLDIAELRRRLGVPPVAGSDAHRAHHAAAFYTEFDTDIRKMTDLVAALRKGEGTPRRNQEVVAAVNEELKTFVQRVLKLARKGMAVPEIAGTVGVSAARVEAALSEKVLTV